MKKKAALFLAAVIAVTMVLVLYVVVQNTRTLIQAEQDESISRLQILFERRFAAFDEALADTDRRINQRMIQALPAIADDLQLRDLNPSALSKADMDEIAGRYGLEHLYFVNKEFVIFNTNFEPDLNYSFKGLGFETFIQGVFDTAGTVHNDKIAISNQTGRLMTYSYYAPPNVDYLIEASIALTSSIELLHGDWLRDLVFENLFQDEIQAHQYLQSIDAYLLTITGGWSLLNEGKKLPDAFVERLKMEGGAQMQEDGTRTIYSLIRVDKTGGVSSALGPEKALALELVYDVSLTDRAVSTILQGSMLALIFGLPFLFAFVLWLFQRQLLEPISHLKASATQIADGAFETEVLDRERQDEVGDLARSFEKMRLGIRSRIDELRLVNKSIERFVPRSFLDLLQKDSIVSVRLGDNTKKEMTILFSDIRDFTTLSEKMTPDENFKFINMYLSRMGPIIRAYDGFIDKYIGDAVMALFERPDDGVRAGFKMLETVNTYNETRREAGRDPIGIGVGLNTGSLMLGTIGEEHRVDGTVISDAVNLASRVEGLTKSYKEPLLITEAVYESLERPDDFSVVSVESVIVKGKTTAVNLLAVHAIKHEVDMSLRRKTLDSYLAGIEFLARGDHGAAADKFEQVSHVWTEDDAVRQVLEYCLEQAATD